MTCQPCQQVPCPHCDTECRVYGCTSCQTTAIGTGQAVRAIRQRAAGRPT